MLRFSGIDTVPLFASIGGDATQIQPQRNFHSVTNFARPFSRCIALGALAFIAAGCMGDQIDATNKLVQQQQEQLEHQQQELEALQANQNQNYTPGAAPAARGGCDKER